MRTSCLGAAAAVIGLVSVALAQPADMVNWWKADGNANDSAGTANGTI